MRVKVDATQWRVPCSVEFVCYIILCKQRHLSETYSPWQFCWQCLSVVCCRHTEETLEHSWSQTTRTAYRHLLQCCFMSTKTVQTIASRTSTDYTDYCFTSTETVQTVASHPQRLYRLFGTGIPGCPPSLSCCSWALHLLSMLVNEYIQAQTTAKHSWCSMTHWAISSAVTPHWRVFCVAHKQQWLALRCKVSLLASHRSIPLPLLVINNTEVLCVVGIMQAYTGNICHTLCFPCWCSWTLIFRQCWSAIDADRNLLKPVLICVTKMRL